MDSFSKKVLIAMNRIPFSPLFVRPRKQHKLLPFIMSATQIMKWSEESRTCYGALSSSGMTHASKGLRKWVGPWCILPKLLHSKRTLPPTELVLFCQLGLLPAFSSQINCFQAMAFLREMFPTVVYTVIDHRLLDKYNVISYWLHTTNLSTWQEII